MQRDQKSSRKLARKAILQCIQEGYSVYICPEGTTHIQPQTLEFRPATFHMAAEHRIPILPVAVEYKDKNDAFIGNDTFLPHFIRTFGKWRTVIHLHIGPILQGDDGEELLKQCKSWIDDSLAKSQAIFSDKDSNQLNKT